jgi:hypothetical protein
MGAFKDKIVKELLNNKQYDLADQIDLIESDVDVANYISANKGYFSKAYTTPDLELMPEFRKAMYSDLKTGEVNLDKEFGEDWYKNYEQIPSDQIKFVADKQGVSYDKLVKEMGEQATKKRRYDIAHDGTIAGGITGFVAPRSVEAIERGESPSATDAALDITQNIAYAAPWARVSAPLARFGLLGRVIQGAAGNALTPTIMETADAVAYDNPDNPRSDFSGTDVATETAVNATTPWLLRGMLMGAGKFTTGKGRELANKFMEVGTDRPTRESMHKVLADDIRNEYGKEARYEINRYFPETNPLRTKAAQVNYYDNKETNELRNKILTKLDLYYNDKVKGYNLRLNNDEVYFMVKDPILSKYLDIDQGFKNMPSDLQLRTEEEIKNYLTNEFGSGWYDQQSPWTRVPIVGTRIDKKLKDDAKQDSIQAKRDSIIYDILKKYGEPRGL